MPRRAISLYTVTVRKGDTSPLVLQFIDLDVARETARTLRREGFDAETDTFGTTVHQNAGAALATVTAYFR